MALDTFTERVRVFAHLLQPARDERWASLILNGLLETDATWRVKNLSRSQHLWHFETWQFQVSGQILKEPQHEELEDVLQRAKEKPYLHDLLINVEAQLDRMTTFGGPSRLVQMGPDIITFELGIDFNRAVLKIFDDILTAIEFKKAVASTT